MVLQPESIEGLLGIEVVRPASPLALAHAVEAGLPVEALERLARVLAPDDPDFKFRLVPKATWGRRFKSASRLTVEEGNRLARLAKVFSLAVEIYRTPEKAREFLHRRHPMLDDTSPLDVALATGLGADLVIGLLGRAAYGGGV